MGKSVRLVRSPRTGRLRKPSALALQKMEAARERQEQALELRKAGATYREIAAALGYANESGAKKACDAVMKRTVFDLAEDIVTLDLQRLDEFQKRCMAQLRTKNDLSQIDRLLRIMERRYMLAGVAPETVKKIQEAYGLDGAVINNAGVMVVQVGHNSEQDFVKKMMQASGIDLDSAEAKHYLERIDPPKELTQGEQQLPPAPVGGEEGNAHTHTRNKEQSRKVRVVRSKGGKKIVVKKKKSAGPQDSLGTKEDPTQAAGSTEGVSIRGSHIGGTNKGVSIGHPLLEPTYKELEESEIIDAEIVEPEIQI